MEQIRGSRPTAARNREPCHGDNIDAKGAEQAHRRRLARLRRMLPSDPTDKSGGTPVEEVVQCP